jgi:cyclohexadieny/prephenate dehydrogenase
MINDFKIKKLLIIGLGLMGGSLARAAKERGFANHISAYGHRDLSLKKGLKLGIIDSYSTELAVALDGVDVVLIATPTLVANAMLEQILLLTDESLVITDAASVKGSFVAAGRACAGLGGKLPGNVVPGHPIAGSERSGVEAADGELFANHRVILTPVTETNIEATRLVTAMWEAAGAEVVTMGVEEHDAILSATSHLPHMLAYALVDALAGREASLDIFKYAAGGFRDFTRIASSDPVMWRDIALANRDQLLVSIDQFDEYLTLLRNAIERSDGEMLEEIFVRAKQSRDVFSGQLLKRDS